MNVIRLSYGCKFAIDRLNKNGFKAYAVGGCVRNSLLGIAPKDYDVTTNALPEDMCRVFSDTKIITNGIKHGTVTVIVNDEQIEITTFRTDGDYTDCRHPETVNFGVSLDEDLNRRDFTVNAMAYSEQSGIIDLFGGRKDLDSKLIRCVGEPDKRFSEDALRIMRALRFASVYGFDIEEETAKSIHRNKLLLNEIAAERIFSELSLLVCGKGAEKILLSFGDVVSAFIPQIKPCVNLYLTAQNHRQTLWEHIARAVGAVAPRLELRLAMLLHDIAKPECKVSDNNEAESYPNHAQIGAELAVEILKSLRAPSKLIASAKTLVEYHDYECEENEASIKRLMRKIGGENALLIFSEIRRADIMAQRELNRDKRLCHIKACADICRKLIDEKACISISQLDVSGSDLISIGFERGQGLGFALNRILDEVIDGALPNERQSLLDFAKSLL